MTVIFFRNKKYDAARQDTEISMNKTRSDLIGAM